MTRRSRFRQILGPDPKGDVDEELHFHLDMRTGELVARGEERARADELARQRFGDLEGTRKACVDISRRRERDMKRRDWFREFVDDVRYAVRTLGRTPGFAAVAVLTLALGIGATTAVFSVVHAVLLEGLPYPQADRLQLVRTLYPDGTEYTVSAPDFMSIQASSRSLDRVEAYARSLFTVAGRGEPREARGAGVSKGLLGLLGLGTTIGRPFAPDDHLPGRQRVVVLDHGFWLREFGGDAGVVGRPLTVGGMPAVVVGVMAAGQGLPERVDFYAPLEYGESYSPDATRGRRSEFLRVIGRAAPGQDAAMVRSDLRRVGSELEERFRRTNERLTFSAAPAFEMLVKDVRTPLLVLFGAVGLVLLVACANVASLLLARGSSRRSELAVRAALGAGRGRLVRQLVAESVVIGLAGGALGALLAHGAVRALVWAQPADIPRLDAVGVDGNVLAFALGCAVLTALVFGTLPAMHATGHRLLEFLRAGGRTGQDGGGHRARGALVVAETALAVVLLVSAGLLTRSFVELTRVNPGFVPGQAASFRVMLQGPAFAERPALLQTTNAILARLQTLPGVTSAAAAGELPLSGLGAMLGFAVKGAPPPPANVNAEIAAFGVSPQYLEALGATLLRGRPLADADNHADAPRVALVNEAAVARWFPDGDPLGERVVVDDEYEIVGVIADMRQEGLREAVAPQLYAPFAHLPRRGVQFVVRGPGDMHALAGAVRQAVSAVSSAVPVSEYAPLEALVAKSVERPRFYTTVLGIFAASALLLAAVGLFGVLSYTVVQRSREIGVRLALGAERGQVIRMVLGSALRLVGVGLVLGIAGAAATGRVLESQLYGVGRSDALTLASVAALLLLTALVAGYLPARRASSLDPGDVLREG